jgi:hypothetical protein
MPSAADILSDPEIAQAYEDVRSDKSETTWLILKVHSTPARHQWGLVHRPVVADAKYGCRQ